VERKLYTAHLLDKTLLSESAQCYHLQFEVADTERFDFLAGQFVSTVATDGRGKQQTRAYSIASAPRSNRFDLCLNRVEGGFFSNLLADLTPGQTVQFHGPHGHFVLPQPFTDTLMIATGTGIAPMRSFVEHLFPSETEDHSGGHAIWLVYGTRHATELYYQKYFERIAAAHPNFHYMATLSRPHEDWNGLRGYVQQHVRTCLEGLEGKHLPVNEGAPQTLHAYICGLNDMVSANRDLLKEMGLDKKQIHFERYD
jgi:ferredoxin-NADP reductase